MTTVPLSIDLGLQLDPKVPAVLDKRTVGIEGDRPVDNCIGLLRYETSGSDSTWPKWVYNNGTAWIDLGTEGAQGLPTDVCHAILQNNVSRNTYGFNNNWDLGSDIANPLIANTELPVGQLNQATGRITVQTSRYYRIAFQLTAKIEAGTRSATLSFTVRKDGATSGLVNLVDGSLIFRRDYAIGTEYKDIHKEVIVYLDANDQVYVTMAENANAVICVGRAEFLNATALSVYGIGT